jgi:hypothetical protein
LKNLLAHSGKVVEGKSSNEELSKVKLENG